MTWYDIAEAELGQAEVPGAGNNARVLEYFAGAGHPEVKADSVPWCAGFVGFCLAQDGIEGSGSLMAKSYLRWGVQLDTPIPGCVVVLERPPDPASGHVGFFVTKVGARIVLRGGNQGDKVSDASFPESMVLSYRWPASVPVPALKSRIVATSRTGETVAAGGVAAGVGLSVADSLQYGGQILPLIKNYGLEAFILVMLVIAAGFAMVKHFRKQDHESGKTVQ